MSDMPSSTFKSPNNQTAPTMTVTIEETYKQMIADLEKEKHYYMDRFVATQKELEELKKAKLCSCPS